MLTGSLPCHLAMMSQPQTQSGLSQHQQLPLVAARSYRPPVSIPSLSSFSSSQISCLYAVAQPQASQASLIPSVHSSFHPVFLPFHSLLTPFQPPLPHPLHPNLPMSIRLFNPRPVRPQPTPLLIHPFNIRLFLLPSVLFLIPSQFLLPFLKILIHPPHPFPFLSQL